MVDCQVKLTYEYGASAENMSTTMIPDAVASVKDADVAVVVLGDTANTCGEMVDRSSIDLPGAQLDLLTALVATDTPVIVVLINGACTSDVDVDVDQWCVRAHLM